jgi:gliding motility-associated lipoprotein GldD
MVRARVLFVFTFLCISIVGCQKNYVPKPSGYYRIALPEKKYTKRNFDCPFTIEIPQYSNLEVKNTGSENYCWFAVNFQKFKAKIFVTYFPVKNNLGKLIEENHKLTFEHQIKANSIEPFVIANDSSKVYGLVYDVSGEVASALQFYVTDSTKHFLRGSLYFDAAPNQDSLAPVVSFLREDVLHLISTIQWK